MIAAVPADIPETSPAVPIVATVVGVLLHVPPEVASDSVAPAPAHAEDAPVIAAGAGWTVTGVVANAAHPAPLTTV